ncbi:hypothetical protein [Methylorubrum sp. SB2]|uniref:hypothetical protein n=1 Tax=Methylorubrum subtropicum TaxID=3138812 RepID=UPI00313ECA79
MLLVTVRAEIAAAQGRASTQAKAVQTLLAAGHDSTDAEYELFRELDGLTLLRERLRSIEALRDCPVAA